MYATLQNARDSVIRVHDRESYTTRKGVLRHSFDIYHAVVKKAIAAFLKEDIVVVTAFFRAVLEFIEVSRKLEDYHMNIEDDRTGVFRIRILYGVETPPDPEKSCISCHDEIVRHSIPE